LTIRDTKLSSVCWLFITKPSNQTLERTADRRTDLLLMTSTLKLEANLAVISGRSARSR